MKFVTIEEGKTQAIVPEHKKGPGPRGTDLPIFYNPAMELNRDVSISFLKAWGVEGKNLLDGMAASGIRGVRMANELAPEKVALTDISHESVELIKRNIELNGVDAQVHHESLERHLLDNRCTYQYIDLDPFGTPVPYLPTVLRYVARGGVVAVSATDTSVLCGTYPNKCMRYYSAKPSNNWCRHENGLRILVGHIVREAARYDRGAVPMLSYYDGHHFRTYVTLEKGAKKADKALSKLESFEFSDHHWVPDGDIGPMYTGKLTSQIIYDMAPLGKLDEGRLEIWRRESDMPPFFYDSSALSKYLKISPPPLDDMLLALKDEGYKAVKTHFSPTGFKTCAPAHVVSTVFNRISYVR